MPRGKCDVCTPNCSLCKSADDAERGIYHGSIRGHTGTEIATVEEFPNVKVTACASCYDYKVTAGKPIRYYVKARQAEKFLRGNYWWLRQQYLARGGEDLKLAMVETITIDYPDMDQVVAEKWPGGKIKRPAVPLTQKKPPLPLALVLLVAYTTVFVATGSMWVLVVYPLVWGVWMLYTKNVMVPRVIAHRKNKWKDY